MYSYSGLRGKLRFFFFLLSFVIVISFEVSLTRLLTLLLINLDLNVYHVSEGTIFFFFCYGLVLIISFYFTM